MQNKLILVVCLILVFPFVLSLDNSNCQYTKEVINSTEDKFLPFDTSGNQLKEVIEKLWKKNIIL